MGRKERVHFPGGLYHVISRGNNRQRIFQSDQDYESYIEKMQSYRKRYGYLLYAYVLMPNHIHLLLEVGQTPLSRIMQGLQQSYALYYNRRYRKVGHLFQGRYKAILCDKESYLLELIRYIHCNPLRAGLVRDLKNYRWSSHPMYLHAMGESIVAIEEVLPLFSKKKQEAVSLYMQFIKEGRKEGHREDYYRVIDQRYLGSEQFVEHVRKEKENEEDPSIEISLSEVLQGVCKRKGVTLASLRTPSRRRDHVEVRVTVAYLARKIGTIPIKESARYFHRDPVTLSILLGRFEDRIRDDAFLQRYLEDLEVKLRRNRKKKYKLINV